MVGDKREQTGPAPAGEPAQPDAQEQHASSMADSNPRSRPHLREYQFAPGQSGNPGGRRAGSVGPKGLMARVNDLLYRTEYMGQKVPGADGRQVLDMVAEWFVGQMIKGSLPHINTALPYTDRPPGSGPTEDEQAAEALDPAVAERLWIAANNETETSEPNGPTDQSGTGR